MRPQQLTRVRPFRYECCMVKKWCDKHGLTTFESKGSNKRRCARCKHERDRLWRRNSRSIKTVLVEEHGGSCIRCGYNRCLSALEFHHRDPEAKTMEVRTAIKQSLTRARREAKLCDLLCANCHREAHEAGTPPA